MPPAYKQQVPLEYIELYESYRSILIKTEEPLQFNELATFEIQIAYCINSLLILQTSTAALRPTLEYLAAELDTHEIIIPKYKCKTKFVKVSVAINAHGKWMSNGLSHRIAAIFRGLANYFLNQDSNTHDLLAKAGVTNVLVNHMILERDPEIQQAIIKALSSLISRSPSHSDVIRANNINLTRILLDILNLTTITKSSKTDLVFLLAAFADDLVNNTEIEASIRSLGMIEEIALDPNLANNKALRENITFILVFFMRSQNPQHQQAATVILNALQLNNTAYRVEIKNLEITELLLSLLQSPSTQLDAKTAATCLLDNLSAEFSNYTKEQKINFLQIIYTQLELNSVQETYDKQHQSARIVCRLTAIDRTLINFYEAVLPLLIELSKTNLHIQNFQETIAHAIANTVDCVLSNKPIDTRDVWEFLNLKLKENLSLACTRHYTRALTMINTSTKVVAMMLNSIQANSIIKHTTNLNSSEYITDGTTYQNRI